jgi:hypothetical protein
LTPKNRKLFILITLAALFFPNLAFASGMEGIGYILVIFIWVLSVTPGAIVKYSLFRPKNSRGILIIKVLITMTMEAIFIAISVVVGLKLAFASGSAGNEPTFLYFAIPIYMMFAIFPNLLLSKDKNAQFLKAIIDPNQFLKAVIISAVTPLFFGVMVIAVMY